jgi:hypothetical protein
MNRHSTKFAFWRHLSISSTFMMLILSPLMASSAPHYAITVVGEAQVMTNPQASPETGLKCKTSQSVARPQASIEPTSLGMSKPVKLKDIENGVALFRTTYVPEYAPMTVTYWLSVRERGSTSYFPLDTVVLNADKIPETDFDRGTLKLQADSLTTDPTEQNSIMIGALTVPTPLYETVQIGKRTEQGLSLTTLICTQ